MCICCHLGCISAVSERAYNEDGRPIHSDDILIEYDIEYKYIFIMSPLWDSFYI